jgi:hypothetical protein
VAFRGLATFSTNVGVKGAKTSNTDDLDLTVASCRFINFSKCIHAIGRGLKAKDNTFAGGVGNEIAIVREWPASGVVDSTGAAASPDPGELDATDFQILPYGFRKDQITGNYCHTLTTFVSVTGTYRKYYRSIISDNILDYNGQLFIGAFSDLVLNGNEVNHSGATTIYIDDDSSGLVMSANSINGTDGDAANSPDALMWLDGASLSDSTINGNKFAHSDGPNVYLNGALTNVSYVGNTHTDWRIDNSGSDGAIKIGSGTHSQVTIVGNTFDGGATSDAPIVCSATAVFNDSVIRANAWDRTTYPALVTGTFTVGAGTEIEGSIKRGLFIPARDMTTRTTNGAPAGSAETATSKVMIISRDFDTTTTEFVQYQWIPPKRWNKGTVTFKTFWTAASGSGTVVWGMRAVAISDNDALDATFGSNVITTSDTLLAANDVHVTSVTAACTIGGSPAYGDYVVFEIFRDVFNDTLGVDAKLLGIELFWTETANTDA